MDHSFESLSQGVFVVPFQGPSIEAGPSKRHRPLQKVCDANWAIYEAAHQAYERQRTEDQLDRVQAWLEGIDAPRLLRQSKRRSKLPVAIIQDVSTEFAASFPTLGLTSNVIQGRDIPDLQSAVSQVVSRFMDNIDDEKKTGRLTFDDLAASLEIRKQAQGSALLLYIQGAQMIPPKVLSELLYIICLHSSLPFRVLLSAPSINVFLPSMTHVEPTSIDLNPLRPRNSNKRGNAIKAITKAARDPSRAPLPMQDDLAESLQACEDLTGGGAMQALKTLKWLLLRYPSGSALSKVEKDDMAVVQAIDSILRGGRAELPPGIDMLKLQASGDTQSVFDPSPRISILHSLEKHTAFVDPAQETTRSLPQGHTSTLTNGETTELQKKRAHKKSASRSSNRMLSPEVCDQELKSSASGGDLKEAELLFTLWRSAGRAVNLWDWLEGFRDTTLNADRDNGGAKRKRVEEESGEMDTDANGKQKEDQADDNMEDAAENGADGAVNEAEMDRLHATFIRFCEECRMMGLVRAKGRGVGRRADEVVKGVGLV